LSGRFIGAVGLAAFTLEIHEVQKVTSRPRIAQRTVRIQIRPKVLQDSLPGDMELQTVTFRYKRGFRQEYICHDDVYR